MPVIINEIVFRGEVRSSDRDRVRDSAPSPSPDKMTQGIVEECVEEVLRILEKKEER